MRSILCALLAFLLWAPFALAGDKALSENTGKSFMVGPIRVGTLKGIEKDGFCVRTKVHQFSGDNWFVGKGSRLDLGLRAEDGASVALVLRW